jgi:hypothetical protein
MPDEPNPPSSFEVVCPCCEATLAIDRETGHVIHHRRKQEAGRADSIGGILGDLEARRASAEKLFQQELTSMKDRERLLDEKMQEAFKRARASKDEKPLKPIDLE